MSESGYGRPWGETVQLLTRLLGALKFRDRTGADIPPDIGFDRLSHLALELYRERRVLYAIGNGASASMASHFAADMAKNGRLHTQVFSDLSLITAIANDLAYEEVFAEPLRRVGRQGDVLLAISSSGRSPNILRAVKVARELGVAIVTLSAMDADNALRQLGDLNAYVPACSYGGAETAHAAVLHQWIDHVVSRQNGEES
jgi:D-sedoheptulose 7-phosphate isomerase